MLVTMRLERRDAITAGALLGLAVLGKGLAPLILFAPTAWFLRRQWRTLAIIGGVMLLVAAPWYILVSIQNGFPFFREFIWKHHFLRFFTGELLHERPFWYNIPVLLAGLFPWTPFLALLFARRLYSDRRAQFLLFWFAWGFVLFSVSRNKLPGYLLPLLPAVAALLGIAIARIPKAVTVFAVSTALLGLIPAIQNLLPQALLSGVSRSHFELPLAWIPPTLMAVAVAIYLECKGKRDWMIGFIALLTTASVGLMVWTVYPVLNLTVSPRGFWVSHSESVTCVPNSNRGWRYGLDYYAGRELPDCQ
jgi:4-amino-4-deoxy-L-arabinose transferase-like glycosyltransferase